MPDFVAQDKAVIALLAIMTEKNLPVCSWIVFADGSGLEGWVVDTSEPTFDTLEAIHTWAAKFGSGVNKTGKVLITFGTYQHVPIRILAKDVY